MDIRADLFFWFVLLMIILYENQFILNEINDNSGFLGFYNEKLSSSV